jgi:hypothetical protein
VHFVKIFEDFARSGTKGFFFARGIEDAHAVAEGFLQYAASLVTSRAVANGIFATEKILANLW